MTTQEKYERYIVSKKHDYISSLMFKDEFNIYLPKSEMRWGSWSRCRNVDLPERWDMKPMKVKGEGIFGPNGNIYILYILGYIPLSLHKLRKQERGPCRQERWWCRLENRCSAWYWRPLWGKLTEQRARMMKEVLDPVKRKQKKTLFINDGIFGTND